MSNPGHESAVRSAGAQYLGTECGFVWFNAPSGSTLVVDEIGFSAERVRVRMSEDAQKDWSGTRKCLVNTGA